MIYGPSPSTRSALAQIGLNQVNNLMEDSICGKETFEKNPETHDPKPPCSNLDRAVTDPADWVIGDRSITDRSIV